MTITLPGMTPARCDLAPHVEACASAILRHSGRWHGDSAELDRLLAELREMKWAGIRAQQVKEE